MPRTKAAVVSLSAAANADMEDESMMPDALPTPESNQENTAPRKGRGRAKGSTNKVSKAKAKPRCASGGPFAGRKKAAPKKKATVKRAPLKEHVNYGNAEDTEEVEDFGGQDNVDSEAEKSAISVDELVAVKQPAKRGRIAGTGKTAAVKKQVGNKILHQIKATAKDGEFEYTPTATRQKKVPNLHARKPGRPAAGQRKPTVEPERSPQVIPDTQDMPVGTEQSKLPTNEVDIEEETFQPLFRGTKNARTKPPSRQPSALRRRVGGASDTEQGFEDPTLKQKLGEMTRRFESLEMRYKTLRDVGIKDAEVNFEKLKHSSEAKTKAANDLIASLKKELATQKAIAQKSQSLQDRIAEKDGEIATAQSLTTKLSASLAEAQNENKSLQAKLSHSRNTSATLESAQARTPGSAINGKTSGRTITVGSAEAAQAAQVAQLKEDLYSDLTGLLFRGVERGTEADVYDCIQTGRNGTLHFKLAITNSAEGSYDDAEYQYEPRLDKDRDKDLMEVLPDYLGEEIMFSRSHAAMFYSRVVEALTKKRVEQG
ncbi:MAG: hypothetical protein Q9167_001850 [Letrouitia subvulpina]